MRHALRSETYKKRNHGQTNTTRVRNGKQSHVRPLFGGMRFGLLRSCAQWYTYRLAGQIVFCPASPLTMKISHLREALINWQRSSFFCEILRWCSADVSFCVREWQALFLVSPCGHIPFSVCELRGGEPHQELVKGSITTVFFFQFDAGCAFLCSEFTGSWWVEDAGARYCTEC